jgi:hypothetical protein
MKKVKSILIIIMFCGFTVATISAGLASGHYRFACDLYENNVGPKPSKTEASGTVLFQFDEIKQEIVYQLRVEKIQDVYMAHLHMGASNQEGLLAVWLYPPRKHNSAKRTIKEEFNGTLAEGVIKQEDLKDGLALEDLIESLRRGNAYVNVHTRNFIMGELRGQVETDQYVGLREEDPGC